MGTDCAIDARFTERMRALRKIRGISQRELAIRTGVSREVIAKMETQRRAVSLDVATNVCTALGTDLNSMTGPDPLVTTIE